MALMERRTAVVTGAARGLGLAVSTAFLAEGARVVMADRDLDEVRHAATTIDPDGDRTLVSSCDVTDAAAVTDLVAAAKSWHGSVDVMVNNAGFTRDATMRKMSEDDFDAVIGVHLRGAWLGTRAAAAIMREQPNGGSIVNVSSISGKVGNPGQTNYSAAKAGVVGLTKAAAKEVGFAGVRVNAVQPGIIETEMTAAMPEDVRRDRLAEVPLGRFGEPREVASVAVFLASDMSSYLTGAVIEISGGRNL